MTASETVRHLLAGSLSRRLALAISLVLGGLITVFVIVQIHHESDVLLERSRTSLLSEVDLLSRSGREWVLSSDVAGLEELLSPVRSAPGLEYAMYLDASGRVLVHSEPSRAGELLIDPLSRAALADTGAGTRLIQQTRDLSDALAPVRQGERLIGWVRVARNHGAEVLALRQAVRDGVLYASAALLLSALLAMVLARGLTGDLRRAQRLFERVREGDLSARIQHRRSDELGDLFSGINDTLDALQRNEHILQLTQERLELAIRGSNDGIWDWDLLSNQVYYSPRWKQMLGYADHELDNRPDTFLDRVHPDELPLMLDSINDYLENRVPAFELIIRARHRDGGWRWILTRGFAVRGRDGRALRMSGTHTDITALKQAEAGLALERSRLYSLLAHLYTGVIMEDLDGRIAVCNRAFCELFPLVENPGELVGRRREEVLTEVRGQFDDGEAMLQRIDAILQRGEPVIGERLQLADGRVIERDCLPIRVGELRQGVLWTFRDISSRIRMERSLAAEKERLRVTLLSIGDAVISTDASGRIDFLNPAAEALTGWRNEDTTGRRLPEVLQLIDPVLGRPRPDPVEASLEAGAASSAGESLIVAHDGQERVVEHASSPIRDALGDISGTVVVLHDATDRYRMQERLRWQATHDPLTGLANRVLLEDRLTQAMARARRQDRLLAVCVLDLDDFKAVNDRLGHEAGDELLQEIARRLEHAVRADDTVARLGGDEFVVLLGALKDVDEMDTCLQRMLEALAAPVVISGEEVVTPASIGVTLYPLNDSDADALLRHADQAMYESKQSGGRCYRLFDFLNSQVSVERLRQRERIGEAISRGEMRLHYQPRVDMREGRMTGVEALVRWQHPEEGLLPPDRFLPLIEHDPEIQRLGEWVIRTALAQLAAWRAEGGRFGVSVNISAPHLLSPGFVTRLSELLAEQPLLPRQALEIEVVESVALDDIERAAAVVRDIRRLGVRVAIDDFGVGYASLGYLRRLPVDVVKIDKSFVLDMLEDEDDFEVVQAVIALAQALRREVVAEGVETAEHGLMLQRLGCSQIQGYGIARPLPADALMPWLAAWRPDPRWAEWQQSGSGSNDLPLFSAVREFNRWTEQVLGLAEGRPTRLADEEIRDPTRCRFGLWFHEGGQQRYGDFEEYRAVDRSHRALHELAVRVADSSAHGDWAAAQAAAVKLRAARDELSVRIEALQRAARRRALTDL